MLRETIAKQIDISVKDTGQGIDPKFIQGYLQNLLQNLL